MSESKAADFHERWVLDYGHASVAEHAVLHLAVEDISRLACDQLENNRLASYTEKSSRYQVIARNSYHVPTELGERPQLRARYTETMDALFEAYHGLLEACIDRLKTANPRREQETGNAHELRVRRMATDACRGVLPAATLTNVGVTANARTMEHAISKLLSSGLNETQELGETLMRQGRETVPTLIKYAARNPYLARASPENGQREELAEEELRPGARLVVFDPYGPERLAEILLYRNGGNNLERARRVIARGGTEEIRRVVGEALAGMGSHDAPPREFEAVSYTVELAMDYGALREFRRHRMMTPIFQPLTAALGTNVPTTITETGLEQKFKEATDASGELYTAMHAELPETAQYVVSHAHMQRTLLHINLRELYHMVRLRTSDRAHESIRVPMQKVIEQVELVHPMLVEPLAAGERT